MRTKTHIVGLDKMLNGGLVRNRSVMLSGPTGVGKSILAMQYLYNGAIKHKEPGLYVTLKEDKNNIIRDMTELGFDIKNLETAKKIQIIGGRINNLKTYMGKVNANIHHVITEIEEVVKENNVKRVVIDSLNHFLSLNDKEDVREIITKLCHKLSELGCTTILVSEKDNQMSRISKEGIEEFIVDGIISIHKANKKSGFKHGIKINKMRGTSHDKETRLFEITPKGVVVYHKEKYFHED